EGLDGVEKMSKSLGNYVGVTESSGEMFGKLMSISDELMWKYYVLLTDLSPSEIDRLKQQVASGDAHPKQIKMRLASEIVSGFHSPEEGRTAAAAFDARFSRGEITPETLPEAVVQIAGGSMSLSKLVAEAGLATSASDASRKIQQGAVKIDREK